MKTTHRYIQAHPISKNSRKLILGTIHPHNHKDFIIPFFYGNKLSLWEILNEAFNNEMGEEINLKGVLQFLGNRRIAVSDTI